MKLIHKRVDSENTGYCIILVTYSTVLEGFFMARKVKKVYSTDDVMKHSGIVLNTGTCTTTLKVFVVARLVREVFNAYEESIRVST